MIPPQAHQTKLLDPLHGFTAAPVECLPLGQHYVLHSQIGGAVVLANANAAELWQGLKAAVDEEALIDGLARSWVTQRDAARGLISNLIRDWRKAGLLSADRAARPAPPECHSRTTWNWTQTFKISGTVIQVRCNDTLLGNVLWRVLRTLACKGRAEATVSVQRASDEYWVSSFGNHLGPYDFAAARHMALRDVICATRPLRQTSAVLHAGAVELNERAIIIAGDSGFGKSTLVAGLVLQGCPYIADDLIGLNRDDAKVRPFPVALSLKPGSYEALRHLIGQKQELTLAGPDDLGLHYLDATTHATELTEIAASKLIFPNFQASSKGLQIRPLSSLEAFQMLLATGTRVAGQPLTLAPLIKLLNETPALELTYSDWREAAEHLTHGPPN